MKGTAHSHGEQSKTNEEALPLCVHEKRTRDRRPFRLSMLNALVVTAAALGARVAGNSTSTVYIIRHGEKTWPGGCLNIQGQERANNLPNGEMRVLPF